MKMLRDSSSIDFAYFPQYELREPAKTEILRIPILPFNSTAPARSNEGFESVIRPEITTTSANGTHIESPSAMSDVTDNPGHTNLNPFDLTTTVTTAASKATGVPIERLQESGVRIFSEQEPPVLDYHLGREASFGSRPLLIPLGILSMLGLLP